MSKITLRKSAERGHAKHGWLESFHTFSFADYYDDAHMHFRALRVINEDFVAPGEGFDTHPHHNMEIITIVLEGALAHKDSLGNTSVIRPGEIQRMTAGTGVTHSEFNHSKTDPVHLYQIWILPEKKGLPPGYEQKSFSENEKKNTLKLVASPAGENGAVTIHQNARLYDCILEKEKEVSHSLNKERGVWVQVKSGTIRLNGKTLNTGDGASIEEEGTLAFKATEKSSFLLFDLA